MIKKILHILVALMILISITGFTVNAHFCHDHLIDLAFFAPAESCCATGDQGVCHPGNEIRHNGHCVDKSLEVGATDDYVGTSFAFNFEDIAGIDLLLSATSLNIIQGSDDNQVREAPWYKEPPPFREVILSQIQTYLI